jgi:hypothetical protein
MITEPVFWFSWPWEPRLCATIAAALLLNAWVRLAVAAFRLYRTAGPVAAENRSPMAQSPAIDNAWDSSSVGDAASDRPSTADEPLQGSKRRRLPPEWDGCEVDIIWARRTSVVVFFVTLISLSFGAYGFYFGNCVTVPSVNLTLCLAKTALDLLSLLGLGSIATGTLYFVASALEWALHRRLSGRSGKPG